MDLVALQIKLHRWRQRNFADTSDSVYQTLGVVEEVGELSHSVLKQAQGIRGTFEEHDAAIRDAVGDMVIYLMGLCSAKGWDLSEVVREVAEEVMQRDWVANPMDGVST